MALTVETGEGLTNADSLVSLDEVKAFALSRGVTLPADDPLLETQIRKAHDYLLRIEARFQGYRRTDNQALPFPRNVVHLYGRWLPDGTIPTLLKSAISQLVIEQQTVPDILPVSDGKTVIRETVGPISTEYALTGASAALPVFPLVDIFLAPLLSHNRLVATRG
jgi:hypothetical protein